MSIFKDSEEIKTGKIGTQNIKITTKKGSVDFSFSYNTGKGNQFDQEAIQATLYLDPKECWELGEFLLRTARRAGYTDPVEHVDFSELESEYPPF